MKKTKVAACLLLLTLCVCASANQTGQGNPSGQSNQPAQAGQPGQPGQPSQANPPSQPNQPGQPAAPSAAGASDHPKMPSVDDQVDALGTQLNFSANQKSQTKTILEDQNQQAMSVVNDSALSRDEKIQKLHTLRSTTISRVRTLLNDDQKKKFDQMVQPSAAPVRQGQAPPANNPPR